MKQWSLFLLITLFASSLFAETGLVRIFTQTNGVPAQVSETPMAAGSNYVTEAPPALAGYTFTHWTLNVTEAGTSRDELGRAYELLPYHLASRVDLTAHYLPSDQDSDGDGVPDAVEIYWYGSLEHDAASDTDGDGLTFDGELAAGTNPLLADSEEPGPVLYADSEEVVYNPFSYKSVVLVEKTDDAVTTNSCEWLRPGTAVETASGSPDNSTFAYWTRNGVACRDELGRALDSVSFTMGTNTETLVAVQVADADVRQKLYWYGTTDIAMDSDTDGDGLTFAEELAAGTNPLLADGEEPGPILVAGGSILLYDPLGYPCLATSSGYTGVYDGLPHGISVEVQRPATGATVLYALAETGPFSVENPAFTDVGEWTVWYQITADGYDDLIGCATVKITKASFGGSDGDDAAVGGGDGGGGSGDGGTDGEEPGSGTVSEDGLSKFDATFVYDGEGHTISTNALVSAYAEAMGGTVGVVYAVDDGTGVDSLPGGPALPWEPVAPAITNAGTAVVWYKVTNALRNVTCPLCKRIFRAYSTIAAHRLRQLFRFRMEHRPL